MKKQLEDEKRMKEEQERLMKEKQKLEEAEGVLETVEVNNDAIKDFKQQEHPVEMPPNADNRTFNVHDILGELDRDNRGNVIVLEDNQGNNVDKIGQPTNIRGYLTNPETGDVLENHTK